eukprot:COSAG05_NODE_6133_length_1017_cov_1.066449_1_plen_211_part_00
MPGASRIDNIRCEHTRPVPDTTAQRESHTHCCRLAALRLSQAVAEILLETSFFNFWLTDVSVWWVGVWVFQGFTSSAAGTSFRAPEVQIFDYRSNQYTLLKWLANAYAQVRPLPQTYLLEQRLLFLVSEVCFSFFSGFGELGHFGFSFHVWSPVLTFAWTGCVCGEWTRTTDASLRAEVRGQLDHSQNGTSPTSILDAPGISTGHPSGIC